MRPSRPTTTFGFWLSAFGFWLAMNVAYAVVNLTISKGLSVSPVCPPMVPRMPDIDLMRVILI
jgi:hypothetical protein